MLLSSAGLGCPVKGITFQALGTTLFRLNDYKDGKEDCSSTGA
jgi:hypothetical protein